MDPFDGSTLHRYLYADNNPGNKADPRGLDPDLTTLGVALGMMSTLNAIAVPSLQAAESSALGKCGPEIHDNLVQVLQDVDDRWATWSPQEKRSHVEAVFWPNANASGAWDINPLVRNFSWIKDDYPGIPTGVCATEGGTVTVDGQCFRPSRVNYVLLGHIAALGHLPFPAVPTYVYVRKALIPTIPDNDTLQWATVGYLGWPSAAHPTASYLKGAIVAKVKAKPWPKDAFTWLDLP
jgi:hypothetical protein